MHLFCIKLVTILIPLTFVEFSQSSILPSSITDKNPSHHQHHLSASAFHDVPSSSLSHLTSTSSSSLLPSSSLSSFSSSSPSSFFSSSSDVESSDVNSESALNKKISNSNNRFHSFSGEESHNSQAITNYNSQQRSSILLPKIYPSSVISDQYASSSISFPSHPINPDEGRSLDYATTLIREALEGPMMHDSNGDTSDYVESSSSSSSSSASSSNFDGRISGRLIGNRKVIGEGVAAIGGTRGGFIDGRYQSNEETIIDSGSASDGDDTNTVQPNEDELFYEVQKLIQYIRESAAHPDDKGLSTKSRNNRNRLTLQMDYLQNLLDEYRQKQGSINLRHWVRGVSPPRLSVTSPIAVLRDALMEEIKRKKIQETQAKIAMNEKILKEVG